MRGCSSPGSRLVMEVGRGGEEEEIMLVAWESVLQGKLDK